jgi:S-adenosylmethionine hydrolase
MAVITLTTEWRPDDIYNGIIKGKLCSLCPGATVIDNASNITPFDISHASFVIRNTFENYPKGSVHIICVQSEAQKGEGNLIIKARGHYFIGTDNGIFNLILNAEPEEIIRIDPAGNDDELEIFAKAASGLLAGKQPSQLGTRLNKISESLPLRATIDSDVIIGRIIFIDSYGNAISNITREIFYRVFDNREFRIYIQSNKNYTEHISKTYNDAPVGDLLARFNSLDLLEISINGANVSELLSIEVGSAVRVDSISKTAPSNRLF